MNYKSILLMLLVIIAGFIIGALLDLPAKNSIRLDYEKRPYEVPKHVLQESKKIA
jgi:hypothetical protein